MPMSLNAEIPGASGKLRSVIKLTIVGTTLMNGIAMVSNLYPQAMNTL